MDRQEKRVLTILIAMLVGLVTLSACEESTIESGNGTAGVDVIETKLSDGTRCAVAIGYNKAGLSCDWQ